jgi:hypothetical protein
MGSNYIHFQYILLKNITRNNIIVNIFNEVEKINNIIKNYEFQKINTYNNNKIKIKNLDTINEVDENNYTFENNDDNEEENKMKENILDNIEETVLSNNIEKNKSVNNKERIIIKKYDVKDELNYDNLTYNLQENNIKSSINIPEIINEDDDESLNDQEKLDKLNNMFNGNTTVSKNKNNNNLLQQLEEIYNNNEVLELNDDILVENGNFDELKQKTNHFIEKCIMNSVIKYDTNTKLYSINLIKLHKNILNYEEENNKKINIISSKKEHSYIIYYKLVGKWTELSCEGLKLVDEKNKFLKICIEKLKNKDKFRKNLSKIQLRGNKLYFLTDKFVKFELYCVSKINI